MPSDTKTLSTLLSEAEVMPVLPGIWAPQAVTKLDFSAQNKSLLEIDLSDTAAFSGFVKSEIKSSGAMIGAGGYNEERIIYNSSVFTSADEPRTIHLGIDLWAPAGTPVMAPLAGRVHSFADNHNYRDYGPTILLEHELKGVKFFTLYGHLSRSSLTAMQKGREIPAGTSFATIGAEHENVEWPPHLHFQVITDLLGKSGDFYGVAPVSQREYYLGICPNPNLILKIRALE